MTTNNRTLWIAAGLVFFCGFLLLVVFLVSGLGRMVSPASPPTIDLFATLSASTPVSAFSPAPVIPTATSAFNFSEPPVEPAPSSVGATGVPTISAQDGPTGHIVFTCQIYKYQAAEQICIMNADGTGYRRLTSEDNIRHFYPSLSPDGRRVLYSAFREKNVYEIYSYDLEDGSVDRLTNRDGVLTAPEYSPDGQHIVYTRWAPNSGKYQIVTMEKNGNNPNNIPFVEGWDPTWSPDGKQILFASARNGPVQLFMMRDDGKNLRQVSNLPAIRGRSDWSPDGQYIVTYSGESWHRELYIMNADGSGARQLTPAGGNSQGPSFSPDSKWVAFTAYFDNYGDDHGCEIYIIRTDGSDLRRLTNNDYCDYQPRWGP
ncbi:MAG: PD40 domain-containing protein [Anaerolineales bacterium]|nr:PD40 domain-containing protein [Anaerolineales bacterium]